VSALRRFAVSVMPRPGILDPQGRAVESALPQLGAASVTDVRVGRRIELTVEAAGEEEARSVVERLARDLLANPLVEDWTIELTGPVAATTGTDSR
jgi:phosphoribosylformylglycinamidine synthase subunit PurS